MCNGKTVLLTCDLNCEILKGKKNNLLTRQTKFITGRSDCIRLCDMSAC